MGTEGKGIVIVTGASRGIGAVSVHAYRDRGYSVDATSRNHAKNNVHFNAAAPGVVGTGYVTGEVLHVDDRAHVGRW